MKENLKMKDKSREKKSKKRKFLDFLVDPFNLYFKNLHIALPILAFFIISIIFSIIFILVFFSQLFSFFSALGYGEEYTTELISFIAYQNPQLFLDFFIKLFIALVIFSILLYLIYLFFYTSTLTFAADIVKGKDKKEILKKCFVYGLQFWKILIFFVVIIILSAIYFLIPLALIFKTPILGLALFLIFLIAYPFLLTFIFPTQYALIYNKINIIDALKITIQNTIKNYWQTFGLFVIPIVAQGIVSFIFNLIPGLNLIVSILLLLFFPAYHALVFMLFIKEKWKI